MATGDEEDCAVRHASVLPTGWFPDALGDAPVLRAVLAMPSATAAWLFALIGFARRQTRLATAEGGWLDLLAFDFLGRRLRRGDGQEDDAFRRRIQVEVLRPRATRPSLRRLLLDLTGQEPRIFEPARPADTGVWDGPGLAYDAAGGWGSQMLPAQVFVDIYRDATSGVPDVSGYDQPAGGYGVGSIQWTSAEMVEGAITDSELLAAVVANKPAGVTAWVRISK